MTMVKRTNAGGRTKGANERSIVFVHQHGVDDVTAVRANIPHKYCRVFHSNVVGESNIIQGDKLICCVEFDF